MLWSILLVYCLCPDIGYLLFVLMNKDYDGSLLFCDELDGCVDNRCI